MSIWAIRCVVALTAAGSDFVKSAPPPVAVSSSPKERLKLVVMRDCSTYVHTQWNCFWRINKFCPCLLDCSPLLCPLMILPFLICNVERLSHSQCNSLSLKKWSWLHTSYQIIYLPWTFLSKEMHDIPTSCPQDFVKYNRTPYHSTDQQCSTTLYTHENRSLLVDWSDYLASCRIIATNIHNYL